MRSAVAIVVCLVSAACASAPAPRPLASGFGTGAGVADPYADGKRHLAEGNYELAAQRFGQALAHDGRSVDALNGLGVAYTLLGRFDSAETQFERALQIEPTNAATLNNYGWTLIEQGRRREARAFLELAQAHGAAAEAPAIAANLESLQHAQRPALLAALAAGNGAQASRGPHRLIRVADSAYLLETTPEPAEPSATPAAPTDASSAPSTSQHEPAATGSFEAGAAAPDPGSPSVTMQDGRAAAALRAAPERPRATPEPGVLKKSYPGGAPIRLWPPLASGADAGAITTGDAQ